MVVTRRNANAEPAQLAALERSADTAVPPQGLPAAKRTKRAKRSVQDEPQTRSVQVESQTRSVQVESQTRSVQVESQTRSVTEITNTTSDLITTSRASPSTPTVPTTITKRRTRSTKAETASPLRALPQQRERITQKRKRVTKKSASETPEPEPARPQPQSQSQSQSQPQPQPQPEPEPEPEPELAHDADSDDQGIFFSKKFDAYSGMEPLTPPATQPEVVQGSESALALLHMVEEAARQSADVVASPSPSTQVYEEEEPVPKNSQEFPVTPRSPSTPSGFFSRSFSALKSAFGFPTSTPQPLPPSPTPSRAPPAPNTMTEVLSVPPTPVGERVRTPAKKKKRNPMLKALTRGVQPEEIAKAEKWARQVIADLKNDSSLGDKRKRLEEPVRYKDLNHFASSKPWETGFGDPLGDMDLDDEDVVPGWAVYVDIMGEEEEHRAKKHKASHHVPIDNDDIVSLDETYAASTRVPSSQKLIDTHGRSASLLDFHPRRSTEPSPMFKTPISHQRGGNVFDELRGHDVAAQIYTDDLESLQRATKSAVNSPVHKVVHNPDQGSFSVPDFDSDDDDTIMNSETSNLETEPLWTKSPPPAPVPAHAPLPEAVADVPSVSTVSQPVDEIERQRQRLMKHTPAKPSRLREAMYPSPSLMSDAGNESMMIATPIQAVNLFPDMPGPEPLDLDDDILAAVEAFTASDEFRQQLAATTWSMPILTYDSDDEEMSSE